MKSDEKKEDQKKKAYELLLQEQKLDLVKQAHNFDLELPDVVPLQGEKVNNTKKNNLSKVVEPTITRKTLSVGDYYKRREGLN